MYVDLVLPVPGMCSTVRATALLSCLEMILQKRFEHSKGQQQSPAGDLLVGAV